MQHYILVYPKRRIDIPKYDEIRLLGNLAEQAKGIEIPSEEGLKLGDTVWLLDGKNGGKALAHIAHCANLAELDLEIRFLSEH